MTKYDIEVQLSGQDGNAYNLLAIVRRALIDAGVPGAEIQEFITQATSGDYDNLLRVCMEWCNIT